MGSKRLPNPIQDQERLRSAGAMFIGRSASICSGEVAAGRTSNRWARYRPGSIPLALGR